MCWLLEDAGSSGADRHATAAGHLHAVQHLVFVVLPEFKPGHHTFHPALNIITLPYRQVGHFVQYLRKFKGEKLLADQGEIEGKE